VHGVFLSIFMEVLSMDISIIIEINIMIFAICSVNI